MKRSSTPPAWLAAVVLTLAGVLGIVAFIAKWYALGFHTRDFGFYVAQWRHLLDTDPWGQLAVNPNGYNLFGFGGTDGFPTVHHDVHLSPVKYLLAVLYAVSGSLVVVHAVYVIAFVVAFTYALRRSERLEPLARWWMLVFVAAAGLSPWYVAFITYDMRTYVFLAPFLLLLATALWTKAPRAHLIGIAVFGLLVREESAILLGMASCFLLLDGRRREADGLYATAIGYCALFAAVYVLLLDFHQPRMVQVAQALVMLTPYPILRVAMARESGLARGVAQRFTAHRALAVAVLALPFAAVMAMELATQGKKAVGSAVLNPRWYPLYLVGGYALLQAWLGWASEAARRRWLLTAAAATVVLAAASGYLLLRERKHTDAAFWRLPERVPGDVLVVTDLDHYAAFAGRDRLIVWERLPAYLEASTTREYPAAAPRLEALLRAPGEQVVIVSPKSWATLEGGVLAAVRGDYQRCAEAKRHVVLHRGTGGCPAWLPR